MTIQVFGDPVTLNTRKVLAALDHMKTAYTLKHISYGAAQHKSVEYLKINPNATVPAAVDGDLVLTESNAILQYAADMTGVGNHPLYPKDLKQRANINRWLFWEASVWFPSCYVYYSCNGLDLA